jgi:3',5'-cyclic-AMP phosphodiesterase
MVKSNRRQFLSLLGAATVSAAVNPRLHAVPTQSDFTFIFFTDTHLQPELDAAHGTAMAFRKARLVKADFAICGGDHVFDATAVTRDRALSLFDLYGKTEQDLGLKVHHTIGNHDVVGMGGELIAAADPMYGRKLWTERFGKTYYGFDHKGYHFVILDSIEYQPDHSLIGHVHSEQLAWLAADLAGQPAGTPIVVVIHIPLATSVFAYLGPASYKSSSALVVTNAADVVALFAGHNVIGVLQGHTHINETVIWQGVPYITSGAVCGNWWRGSRLGVPEGYTVVHLSNGKLSTRYETYGFKSVSPADGPGSK